VIGKQPGSGASRLRSAAAARRRLLPAGVVCHEWKTTDPLSAEDDVAGVPGRRVGGNFDPA
jgi:hypothetical protein